MLTTRSFETRLRKLERKHRSPIDDVSALSDEELDAALRAVYRQLIAEHGGVEAAEAALRADLNHVRFESSSSRGLGLGGPAPI